VTSPQSHLAELHGADVSPDLISGVTDAFLEEMRGWQNRPVDPVYPVVFFDAFRVKIAGLFAGRGDMTRRAEDAD